MAADSLGPRIDCHKSSRPSIMYHRNGASPPARGNRFPTVSVREQRAEKCRKSWTSGQKRIRKLEANSGFANSLTRSLAIRKHRWLRYASNVDPLHKSSVSATSTSTPTPALSAYENICGWKLRTVRRH